MTVHSEDEAVRQAKEYLDIGFVVNAIKRPDGSIAHDQDQLSALYHGFEELGIEVGRKADAAKPPRGDRGYPAAGYCGHGVYPQQRGL